MELRVSYLLRRSASVAAIVWLCAGTVVQAQTSPNTGSLGSSADGTNASSVTSGPGAVTAGGDSTAVYTGQTGSNTTIGFRSALNPPAASPFTIEFWARPTTGDNDDAVVSNRVASGDRSGWVFFQRPEAQGWNLRMYNGSGSTVGWDLTGGTSTLSTWSHVVATWNGSAALLYVNGVLVDDSNAGPGGYNASTSAPFVVGTNEAGTSAYTGAVDEVAFYDKVLSAAQIANHFSTVTSPTAGAYHELIRSDGALLQLSNNVPEPSSMLLLGVAGVALLRRRQGR